MILKEFPDIQWLREQAKTGFFNQKGVNNITLPQKGWPNVVLNTTNYGCERRDIVAPFSLFLNLNGDSIVSADRQTVKLKEDTCCVVNKGQHYDLIIPENSVPTTTFNLHFGDSLYEETFYDLKHSHAYLLDNPSVGEELGSHFFIKTRWKDTQLLKGLNRLIDFYTQPQSNQEANETETILLYEILKLLLFKNVKDLKGFENIKSVKCSTRIELMKRLGIAIDYIYSCYTEDISLDTLSKIACMSKFHFLRTFKAVFGCTPYQFVKDIRLKKAELLLTKSKMDIGEIALNIGFNEPNSFYKFFQQSHKTSPMLYRLAN